MDLTKAQQLIGEAVENPAANVDPDELARACATVLLHGGLMALKPLEIGQNTAIMVMEQ